MRFRLNVGREPYRVFPDIGEGAINMQMPLLIADGRVPMNVAQFMQKRLDSKKGEREVYESWRDFDFYTGDGIAYHPDGEVKIILDCSILSRLVGVDPKLVSAHARTIMPEAYDPGQIRQSLDTIGFSGLSEKLLANLRGGKR